MSEAPLRPVVPCLVIGSWDYRRASNARKIRAATTGTIPEMIEEQREIQRVWRAPVFDPHRALALLEQIERFATGRPASLASGEEGTTE